jgi:hypothetical protein
MEYLCSHGALKPTGNVLVCQRPGTGLAALFIRGSGLIFDPAQITQRLQKIGVIRACSKIRLVSELALGGNYSFLIS